MEPAIAPNALDLVYHRSALEATTQALAKMASMLRMVRLTFEEQSMYLRVSLRPHTLAFFNEMVNVVLALSSIRNERTEGQDMTLITLVRRFPRRSSRSHRCRDDRVPCHYKASRSKTG